MSRRHARWLRAAGLTIGGIALWQTAGHFIGQRSGPEKLVNQVWLERWPKDPRDMVWHFVAVNDDQRKVGRLGRASHWRVASDGFVWRQEGARLDARFPQNDCRTSLQARTWTCEGEAPKPFELCLELRAGHRVFRYYSRKNWEIRPHGEVAEDLGWLAPSLLPALAPDDDGAAATATDDGAAAVTGDCAAFGPSE
jgi:hypothetical protein